MPIYTYLCKDHGEFDDLRPSPEAQAECPKCGKASKRTMALTAPDHCPRTRFQTVWKTKYGNVARPEKLYY